MMQKKYRRRAFLAATALSVSCFMLQTFATVENIEDAVNYIYNLLLKLFIPIAIIALAAVSFALFSGNEQAMEKVPMRIKYIVASLCGMLLLSVLINWGAHLGQGDPSNLIAWDPQGNNTIVSDIVPGANVYGLVEVEENDSDGDAADTEETEQNED